MVDVTITDTGKRRVSDSTATETKANNGNPFTLCGVSLSYGINTLLNNTPYLAYWNYNEVDKTGFENPTITITGYIDMNDNKFDIMTLIEFAKSKGVKILTGDFFSAITESTSPFKDSTIYVRVVSLQFSQQTLREYATGKYEDNLIEYNLSLVQTG